LRIKNPVQKKCRSITIVLKILHPKMFLKEYMKNNPGLNLSKNPTRENFKANYPDPSSRFKINLGDYEHPIIAMVFTADLSVETQQIPISKVTEYKELETDRIIAQSVHFEIGIDNTAQELAIHKIKKGNAVYFTVSSSEVKPDNTKQR
jgi:hypothetical protein